jgi:hypothetical protein
MANPIDTVTSVSKAIEKFCDVLALWIAGGDKRRLQYQLEAAQEYIFVDERAGKYKEIEDHKALLLKIHFKRRAFDSK